MVTRSWWRGRERKGGVRERERPLPTAVSMEEGREGGRRERKRGGKKETERET